MSSRLQSQIATRVYFIQEGTDGPIKIGIAEDLGQRLRILQCGNPRPLRIRCTLVAGHDVERALHEEFAQGRIRGEWFDPSTPGLAELMETVEGVEFDEFDLCERCRDRPIAVGRRKYCERCAR